MDRDKLIEETRFRLGEGLVFVELEAEHFNTAIDLALARYRLRSNNAMEESFVFLTMSTGVNAYTLPDVVQEVHACYRRSNASIGNAGGAFDPFSSAFVNNIYMVQNPSGMPGGGSGTLALYDFARQHNELVGRMFGRDLLYTWTSATNQIVFHRDLKSDETVALHVFNEKPEEVLLKDYRAIPMLQDYTLAFSKQILGEGRGKWGSLAGPQGGITLNGNELKTEALDLFTRVDDEIKRGLDASDGYGFVIG